MNRIKHKSVAILSAVIFAMAGLLLTACGKEVVLNVVDGNVNTEITTKTGKTIAEALEEAQITLAENDLIDPALDTKITEDMTEIVIRRSITVSIKDAAAGTSQDVTFNGLTVDEALQAAGITLGENDTTIPQAGEQIKSGDVIEIHRTTFEEEVVEEEIPFEKEKAYSANMYEGQSKVTQAGVNGKKKVKYKITIADGKETGREVIAEKVVQEAVSEITTYGTAKYVQPTQPAGRYEVSREAVPDCADGSSGYYVITYSDGSVEYQEYGH